MIEPSAETADEKDLVRPLFKCECNCKLGVGGILLCGHADDLGGTRNGRFGLAAFKGVKVTDEVGDRNAEQLCIFVSAVCGDCKVVSRGVSSFFLINNFFIF